MAMNELTKRFKEKVEKEEPNLKKLAVELDIPYDRMYSWLRGKGNPKPPDDKVVENWINGINSTKSQPKTPNMNQDDRTEDLITSLKERITELKESNALLREHNQRLQVKVNTNLETILKNQLTHLAVCTAFQEMALKLLAKLASEEYQTILNTVHNDEVEKMLDYNKRGNDFRSGNPGS